MDYQRHYVVSKEPELRGHGPSIGMELDRYVYARPADAPPRIFRTRDPHPVFNFDAFCYHLLLCKVPFFNENTLLSGGSYFGTCRAMHMLDDEAAAQHAVEDYCGRHLTSNTGASELFSGFQKRMDQELEKMASGAAPPQVPSDLTPDAAALIREQLDAPPGEFAEEAARRSRSSWTACWRHRRVCMCSAACRARARAT